MCQQHAVDAGTTNLLSHLMCKAPGVWPECITNILITQVPLSVLLIRDRIVELVAKDMYVLGVVVCYIVIN